MPPLLFPLPTTALLTFSQIFIDPSSSHTTILADATAARTKLQIALKAFAGNEPGASAIAVVEAVQVYLPYLRGIISSLDADTLLYKAEPAWPWRPSITSYTASSPLLPLPSIHAEHAFVLVTYTLALSNFAYSILAALPAFEPKSSAAAGSASQHMSSEDEKRTTAGLARAVDLLCQASGVAEWAAENVCSYLDSARIASGRVGKSRWPIETNRETFRGLAMMLLADAHVTAIRKLLLPVQPHMLFAPPGPPLPSNHPSPSLLAKLYLHVASLYTSARALLRVQAEGPPPTSSTSASRKIFGSRDKDMPDTDTLETEPVAELSRYLRKESLVASAFAHKWLGVDAGENGKGGQKIGEALALVKEAQGRLEELEGGKVREKMKGLSLGKNSEKKKDERKARKGRIERELEDVAAWVRSYARMNDTVSFQPVPPISSLTIPSGRPIFAAKPFKPPRARFGPEVEGEDAQGSATEDNYAGKGNYY